MHWIYGSCLLAAMKSKALSFIGKVLSPLWLQALWKKRLISKPPVALFPKRVHNYIDGSGQFLLQEFQNICYVSSDWSVVGWGATWDQPLTGKNPNSQYVGVTKSEPPFPTSRWPYPEADIVYGEGFPATFTKCLFSDSSFCDRPLLPPHTPGPQLHCPFFDSLSERASSYLKGKIYGNAKIYQYLGG